MLSRHRELYCALSVLLIVSLIALPVHATVGETQQETVCRQAPTVTTTRAASADAEFIRAAAVDKLRPVGAAVALLDDGSSVGTSVATRKDQRERSGVLFFRRDALYAPGSSVPGMFSDTRLGMDPDRDVLWVKITLSLPGESSLKSTSLEYNTEYRASEVPAFEGLGAGEATALLKDWAATARPLVERATVVRDGGLVLSEEGSGSFERAVESFGPSSRGTAAPLKSRSSCRQGCATRYLGSVGRFDVACIIVNVLVCIGICYVSYGSACAACLGYLDGLCGYLGSVVSLFNYLRCYIRC
jgi:hypothetical protein